MSSPTPVRPTLLTIGLVLNVLHAGLVLVISGLVLLGMLGGFGISLATVPFVGGLFGSMAFGIGALVAGLYVAFYATVLYVCAKCWSGSRGATWALILLSVMGLMNTGFLSALVAVLTIVGAVQFLDATRVAQVGATTEVR